MNKIVRAHYPVADLPEDLRSGLDGVENVTLVIEPEVVQGEAPLSIEELFAMRRPPYKTTEEIVAEVRRQRNEWDDR